MESTLPCDREGAYHCLDLFDAPRKVLKIEDGEERERKLLDRVVSRQTFAKGELACKSPLTLVEEILVVFSLLLTMGGPLFWFVLAPACLFLLSGVGRVLYAGRRLHLEYTRIHSRKLTQISYTRCHSGRPASRSRSGPSERCSSASIRFQSGKRGGRGRTSYARCTSTSRLVAARERALLRP